MAVLNSNKHSVKSDARSPYKKLTGLLLAERKDIIFIYLYSLFVAIINLSLPLGIQGIITRVSGGLVFESVYILIGMVVAGIALSGILQIMQISLVEIIQRRVLARTAFSFTHSLLSLRFDAVRGVHLPEMMNRFFDVLTLQKGFPKLLIDLSAALLQILVGLLLLSFYHPYFTLLAIFLFGFLFLLFRFTGPEGLRTSLLESSHKYALAHWLAELARIVRPARLFNRDPTLGHTDHLVGQYLDYRERHFAILIRQYNWIVVFKVLVIGGLLLLGTTLVVKTQITLGQFVASEFIVITLVAAVEKIIMYMDVIYDMLTGAEKLSQVTGMAREAGGHLILDTNGSAGITLTLSSIDLKADDGTVLLDQYTAQMAPGTIHVAALHNQDQINSLTDILMGSQAAHGGIALANGIPIRELKHTSWRPQVGLYTGAHDLFAGTIEDNIRMAMPTFDYKTLIHWLAQLGVADYFLALPGGLATYLLPSGRNLPGALAEALPLAIRLACSPALLIIKDGIRFAKPEQKTQFIRIVASYAVNHTVLVFSLDEQWKQYPVSVPTKPIV